MKKKSIRQKELREIYRTEERCLICGKKPLYTKIFCKKCHIKHKGQTKRWNEKKIKQNLCTRCGKKQIESRNLCKECKEIIRISNNIWGWKGRIKLLKDMGGKCNMCGNDDLRVIEIDHVKQFHHRKNGMPWLLITHNIRTSEKVRQKLLQEYKKGELQLLCRNCQRLKDMGKSNIYYNEALKDNNDRHVQRDFKKILEDEKRVV